MEAPSMPRLPPRLNPALRDTSPIDLGGIRVMRTSGKIETGKLDPVGQLGRASAALAGIVTPADEALSLEVLNRDSIPSWPIRAGPTARRCSDRSRQAASSIEGKTLLAGALHRRQDGRVRRPCRRPRSSR